MDLFTALAIVSVALTIGTIVWAFGKVGSIEEIDASDVSLLATGLQDPSLAVAAYTAGKSLVDDEDKDDLDVSTSDVFNTLGLEKIDTNDLDEDLVRDFETTEELRTALKLPELGVDTGTEIIDLKVESDKWITEGCDMTKEQMIQCWGCEKEKKN
jgi:hypothetical protein